MTKNIISQGDKRGVILTAEEVEILAKPGPSGNTGNTGETGQSIVGPRGLVGPTGIGITGPTGPQGDMSKLIYDFNNDGRINAADNATEADNISGIPGADKFYGTDNLGTKGFHNLSSIKANDSDKLNGQTGGHYAELSSLIETQTNLTSHTGNTGNPHDVTTSQIGAATESALIGHMTNINNPHSITPLQIGNTTAQWNADRLRGKIIASIEPNTGEILKWNGAQWEPSPDLFSGGGAALIVVYEKHDILTDANISWIMSTTDDLTTYPIQNIRIYINGSKLVEGVSNHYTLSYNSANTVVNLNNGLTLDTGDVLELYFDKSQVGNDIAQWNANRLQGNNIGIDNPVLNDVLRWNGSIWTPSVEGLAGGSSFVKIIYDSDWQNFPAAMTLSVNMGITFNPAEHMLKVYGQDSITNRIIEINTGNNEIGINNHGDMQYHINNQNIEFIANSGGGNLNTALSINENGGTCNKYRVQLWKTGHEIIVNGGSYVRTIYDSGYIDIAPTTSAGAYGPYITNGSVGHLPVLPGGFVFDPTRHIIKLFAKDSALTQRVMPIPTTRDSVLNGTGLEGLGIYWEPSTNEFVINNFGETYVDGTNPADQVRLVIWTTGYDIINRSEVIGTNGYRIDEGLITQWGHWTGVLSENPTTSAPFNIVFPNTCFNVQLTIKSGSTTGTINSYITSFTNSTFSMVHEHSADTIGIPYDIYWTAIGN